MRGEVGALAFMATVGLTGMAQAQLTGWFWETTNSAASDAEPSNPVYGTTATDTFTVSGLPLSFNAADTNLPYTIGPWLATGGVIRFPGD